MKTNSPNERLRSGNSAQTSNRQADSQPRSGPQRRSDLEVQEEAEGWGSITVVKDPLSQKYFRLPYSAWFILKNLDGQTTLDQVLHKFNCRFPNQQTTKESLERLVCKFHGDGLLRLRQTGIGNQFAQRRQQQDKMELVGKFSNILAIRFRGIDPERILTVLDRYIGWLFSKVAVTIVLAIALIVFIFLCTHLGELARRMPQLHEFFVLENFILFGIIFSSVKILHEFGHGLACKRAGGECHELGFMLLVMTPCLYCNVSDSWLLKSKWDRAAIAAAGIYVEIILATLGAIVWMNTSPGLINMIALQVMILCSISTIAFNGNPLLRFDGYYILSDVLEIPNLMQRANSAFKQAACKLVLGHDLPVADPIEPAKRIPFVAYSISATLYRVVVLFSIAWFLCRWLEPYGLKSLGVMVAIFAFFGILFWPMKKLIQFLRSPSSKSFKKHRILASASLAGLLVAFTLLVPLPHFVHCPIVLVPQQVQSVFAETDGTLAEVHVSSGQVVRQGQILAELDNDGLELQILQTELLIEQAKIKLNTQSLQGDSMQQIESNRVLNAELLRLNDSLDKLEQLRDSTKLVSKIDGVVVTATTSEIKSGHGASDDLSFVLNSTLDPNNRGMQVRRGSLVCEVIDPSNWKVIFLLNETNVGMLQNQETKIRLARNPHETLKSEIIEVGTASAIVDSGYKLVKNHNPTPDSVSAFEGLIDVKNIQDTTYVAVGTLQIENSNLRAGEQGNARIYCGTRTLGQRMRDYWVRNFK